VTLGFSHVPLVIDPKNGIEIDLQLFFESSHLSWTCREMNKPDQRHHLLGTGDNNSLMTLTIMIMLTITLDMETD